MSRFPALLKLAVLVTLLTPGVGAQGVGPSVIENFEDDAVGFDPTASWYTYSEATATGLADAQILTGKQFGTVRQVADAGSSTGTFTLNVPGEADSFTFTPRVCFTSGGGSFRYILRMYSATGQQIMDFQSGDLSSGIAGMPDCPNLGGFSGTTFSQTSTPSCGGTSLQMGVPITITFDWVAKTYQATDGVGTLNCPFLTASAADLGRFSLIEAGTTARHIGASIDDITIQNISEGVAPPGSGVENPLDAMRRNFAVSWGMDFDSANWLFGIGITSLVFLGFASVSHSPIVLGTGLFLGVGLAFTLGYFQLYVLLILVFLIIAVVAEVLFGGAEE